MAFKCRTGLTINSKGAEILEPLDLFLPVWARRESLDRRWMSKSEPGNMRIMDPEGISTVYTIWTTKKNIERVRYRIDNRM